MGYDYDQFGNYVGPGRGDFNAQGVNRNGVPSRQFDPAQAQNRTASQVDPGILALASLLQPIPGAGVPSFGETTRQALQAQLEFAPRIAQQQFEEQTEYLPKQAQLALQLQRAYGPQQARVQLDQLREFLPQFQEVEEAGISRSREADLADALALAPQLRQIQEAGEDPRVTAIRGQLTGQIADELAAGTRLTPQQAREVEQGLRSSEISRGIGMGQGSANREAVAKALEGQRLLSERQDKAGGLLQLTAGTTPDPFVAALGRPATALGLGQQQFQSGLSQPTQTGQIPGFTGVLGPLSSLYGTQVSGAASAAGINQAATQNQNALLLALANPNLTSGINPATAQAISGMF